MLPSAVLSGSATAWPQEPASVSAPDLQKAFSIFHEPWWLDIATHGRWAEATMTEGAAVVGRLPYAGAKFGMPVSALPELIPTLGSAIAPVGEPGEPSLSRRLEIADALIGREFPSY
ncbi:MAG TPA: hypothetical protein VGG99_00155 [Acetobacteraceae bacterium]